MIAISDAIGAHVNQGFTTFACVRAAIEAGETVAEVDAGLTLSRLLKKSVSFADEA